jgi:uncharacterized protein (UPF0332 family)
MTRSDLILEKATRALRLAERLFTEEETDFAASKVYYAYFYTAQALLTAKELKFARHGQVIAQYGLHFSKTQALDPRFHKLLDRAFGLRQIADYQIEVVIDPEAVGTLISECREFIDAASRYLRETDE